jgi:hypothetical protein
MLKDARGWFAQRWVTHPFLFAALPMIMLAAHNAQEIAPSAGIRAIVLLEFGMLVAFFTLQRWLPDKQRCAILCSLFMLLFFSYDHVDYGLVTQSTFNLFSGLGLV